MSYVPFEMNLIVDPDNPQNVVPSADITMYNPTDTGRTTPLALQTTTGVPLANPIRSNQHGFIPAFAAPIPQVMWYGGGFTGYISSYQWLLDQAIAAREAAEAAASNGMPAGGAVGQILTKTGGADFAATWVTKFVVIGPAESWPTGLPDGTIVVRREV
jgi:hypothetical protein